MHARPLRVTPSEGWMDVERKSFCFAMMRSLGPCTGLRYPRPGSCPGFRMTTTPRPRATTPMPTRLARPRWPKRELFSSSTTTPSPFAANLAVAKTVDSEALDDAVEADESHELHGAPLRAAWADIEDSESECDLEWEQVHACDWAKVATSSHLPGAPISGHRRSAQRRRRRAGLGSGPAPAS